MVEGGELPVPHLAEWFHPVGYLAECGQPGFAISLPSLAADGHQPAFREHFDMLRDGGTAHGEIFGDRVQIQGLTGDKADDVPSDGVGYCLEYISSGLHGNKYVSIYLQIYA